MDELREIISRTNVAPTIINSNSNFVVITYWWGRNNLNNNTARPCVAFYEDFFKQIVKFSLKSIDDINKLYSEQSDKLTQFYDNIQSIIQLSSFKKLIKRKVNEYLENIYSYAGILENSSNKFEESLHFLERLKET